MGLPVIATNWSGPTAFLDDSVGYPLRFDGLEEVCDPPPPRSPPGSSPPRAIHSKHACHALTDSLTCKWQCSCSSLVVYKMAGSATAFLGMCPGHCKIKSR